MKLRSLLVLLSSLSLVPLVAPAGPQSINPVTFGNPTQLSSGSYFPVRAVANITHPDPNDPTKDVIDPIDFDGDGNSDFAYVESGSAHQVTVWLRQADGSYTSIQFAAPDVITDLAVADINGDGKPDLVVAAGGNVLVYTNDGVILHDTETTPRLSFTLAATLSSTGDTLQHVAVSDLNGDGLPDVVATSTFQDQTSMANVGHVVVFMQAQGTNNFAAGVVYTLPFSAGGAGAIAIGPLVNADAIPDVAVSDPSAQTLIVLPGNGDGTLGVNSAIQAPLTHTAVAIALADVDGDGRRDIYTAGYLFTSGDTTNHLTVNFLHNKGNGFDSSAGWEVGSSPSQGPGLIATDLAVGDFNLDGTLDVAVANSLNGGVGILLGQVTRDTSGAFTGLLLSLPTPITAGANTRTVTAAYLDGDNKLDLVVGDNDSADVNVVYNTSTLPPPTLSGKKVQFEASSFTLVKDGSEAFIKVLRASDSPGKIIVPFTIGGTAVPNPKVHSDYSLDDPATKKLVFEDGVTELDIMLAITGDAGSAQNATIILTLGTPTDALGKPTTNAVLGPIRSTTLTLVDTDTPSIHAANTLTVKPSSVVPLTAAQLAKAHLKAAAYNGAPWVFTVSQTANAAVSGLSLKVQYATSTGGPWVDFPGNVMQRIKPGSPVWTTTASAIPPGTQSYFRVETSAPGYVATDTAAVGAYAVFNGPTLAVQGTQCPYPLASNPNNFTSGAINTHNSESIQYHFIFSNTGQGPAFNVAIDIPLPPLTHFGGATVPHLSGGQLVQLDRKGKPTSSNLDTVALRYTYSQLDASSNDFADVIVDVISANEYNPKYEGASFGLHVGMHAFRISSAVDISTSARTTVYGTPSALVATISSPLTVTMKPDQTIASPGHLINYTATISNTSAVDYKEAVFTATLPAGVALETVDIQSDTALDFNGPAINPTSGTNPSVSPFQFGDLQTLTWTIGTIPAGKSLQILFTVRAQYDLAPDVIDGPKKFHTNEIDLTTYNLVATPPTGGQIHAFHNNDDGPPARTLVSAADPEALPQIGFVKQATGLGQGGGEITEDGLAVATVLPNDQIEYQLNYFNTGGSPARGCVIQEEIPSNAIFVGFMNLNGQDFAPGTYVMKDGGGKLLSTPNHTITVLDLTRTKLIEFHVGNIPAGGGGYLKYRVQASAAANTHILSQGYRMYTESLSQAVNGKPVQVPVKVVLPISFDINTKANKFEVSPGEQITYTVRFRNNGGIAAQNVVVSCPLPAGATYVSGRFCDESKNTITGTVNPPTAANKNTISFNIGTLVPEEGFTDVNGNGFHDAGEPYTDTNLNGQHNNAGEGLVEFTVQVQNPLPLSLRLPSTMLQAKASIVGMYPKGALVHASALRNGSGGRFAADASTLVPTPLLGDEALTRIKDPLRANLWGLKTAPQFVTKGQRLVYRIVAGNSGNVQVNNVQIAIQVPYGTTLDATNSSPGYSVSKGIVVWNLGNIPAHGVDGRALVVSVNLNAAYKNDTLEENSCFITSKTLGAGPSNSPDCVPGPSRTTVLSTSPVVAAWQSFGAWLGSLGGNIFGHGNATLEQDVHRIDSGTVQSCIRGVDVIALQNGALLIQNGGGNIVAAGGGNLITDNGGAIVAAGGGNLITDGGSGIVAAGGGNIVAAGGGNLISVQGVGFLTQANLTNVISGIVAAGGGNIVAAGGGNLIGQDGTTLIGLDGSPLISQDGSGFKLTPQTPGIVAAGGGNIVATGGGNIVAAGGGNIVAQGAGNLVAQGAGNVALVNPNGAGVVSIGAGNIVAQGGGNIVAQGAGNIVAQGGGN